MSYLTQVIQPVGSIDAANAKQLQDELMQVLSGQSCQVLLVDLAEVELLDSAGLMVLVSAYRAARRLGKQFTLCAVPPAVQIVLELTQLDRVFEIHTDVPMLALAA